MKILMVTNGYPDYPGSYRGIFIKKLCHALKKQGLNIVVLCPRVFRRSPFFEMDDGIPIHRFWYPSGEKPLGQSGRVPKFAMVIYMITGFIAAMKLIIREKPDIIHGNWIVPTGLIAAATGKLTGRPVINSVRGMDYRIAENRLIKPLFKLAAWLSDIITVVSESMLSNKALSSAEVISSGIDDRFFEAKADPDSKMVISTRSLEPIYDVETLIRAVPLVVKHEPDARFIIVGGGSLREHLQALCTDLGVSEKVTFTGMLENSEIPSYMEKSKVYVSTSLADGTSVSLLEALAAGLVPVVSDIEANTVFINENGLFKKGDSKNLAEAIVKALNSSGDSRISRNADESISWPSIAEKYFKQYNQIADINS